jgi:hypothetical protein
VPPKWWRSITLDLKKEGGWGAMDTLNEVLAYQKAACDEKRTGTYPVFCIWPVRVIDGHCNLTSFQVSPRFLELPPP